MDQEDYGALLGDENHKDNLQYDTATDGQTQYPGTAKDKKLGHGFKQHTSDEFLIILSLRHLQHLIVQAFQTESDNDEDGKEEDHMCIESEKQCEVCMLVECRAMEKKKQAE